MSIIEKLKNPRRLASAVLLLSSLSLGGCDSGNDYSAIADARTDDPQDPVGDSTVNQEGAQLYAEQCANCHGEQGQDGPGGSVDSYTGTLDELASNIHDTMPVGNTASCEDNCAEDVAQFMWVAILNQSLPTDDGGSDDGGSDDGGSDDGGSDDGSSDDGGSNDGGSDDGGSDDGGSDTPDPTESDPSLILSYYTENVEASVTQATCSRCHSEDGAAQNTGLVFEKGNNLAQQNQSVFSEFFNDTANSHELILSKVRGGAAHGGEVQFSCEETEFKIIENYLQLLAGSAAPSDMICAGSYWDDIIMSDASKTLRRAALLMAGRLPTEQEISQAQGSDAGLRTSLKSLMTGDNFHEFLLRGSNDQLLMKGLVGTDFQITSRTEGFYPVLANKNYDANVAAAGGDDTLQREFTDWFSGFKYGIANAPLKLIAHVVENDLPYTDILTANYTMVNPYSNEVFRSGIEFDDDTDALEFKPGLHQGQILDDDEYDSPGNDKDLGRVVNNHSGFIDYPHAGLLNDPAYLNRYPSTDTNRNRARASWTYKHFLNFDIEKSAARTTDPDDLADTDNPTLNNSACTACHVVMDPVAGAFQNYGDSGRYRRSSGGLDSLPSTYKRGNDSLYEDFDTWYRDMLEPGFNGAITEQDNSLQILGQRIVDDERFPKAAVAFWWPAIMSGAVPQAPEEITDPNYLANLNTFETVQADINELASGFANGFNGGSAFNLKDLLVEMFMTRWFQAHASEEELSDERAVTLANVGSDRLLTPEELALKTKAIMGFAWGEEIIEGDDDPRYEHLSDKFNIYYGGIDSIGITERAKNLTALMSNVALGQALSVSCPATVMDINRDLSQRILFTKINRHTTPLTLAHGQFEIAAQNNTETYNIQVNIPTTGQKTLRFSFDNQFGNGPSSRRVYLDRFAVASNGGSEILSMEAEDILENDGVAKNYDGSTSGSASNSDWSFTSGYIEVPIIIEHSGDHTITIEAYGVTQADGVAPKLSAHINSDDPYSNTLGEIEIKSQLQFLHQQLLADTLELDSEELNYSYQFFVEAWQARWDENLDFYIFDDDTETCEEPDNIANFSDDELADPQHTMAAWSQVLLYLMTDYKYLHE
jgi:mono/diheme cytochrome c family protein